MDNGVRNMQNLVSPALCHQLVQNQSTCSFDLRGLRAYVHLVLTQGQRGHFFLEVLRVYNCLYKIRVMAVVLLSALLLVLGGCSSNHTPVSDARAIPQTSQQVISPLAHDVLFRALGLVGIPYRWGGNTPESGFDCSGLIGYVYRDVTGIALPRTTSEMSQMRAINVSREALLAGDLVFFATDSQRRVTHAGIYVGEGRFIHAPSAGGTVRMDSLNNRYWQSNYLAAKRVLAGRQLALNP